MALKRKRSTTLQSSSPSTATTTSSPLSSSPLPAFYTNSKPTASIQPPDKTWSFPTYASDPYAPSSRTRKRHRDDRPTDAVVHGQSPCWIGAVISMSSLADVCRVAACTMSRLYAAQRERPMPEPAAAVQPHQMGTGEAQKSTLHAFWSIRAPPRQTHGGDLAMAGEPGPKCGGRCEDCDGDLQSQDAMDVDGPWGDRTCYSCRRNICDACAVMENERVCSACIGFGWGG